MLARAEGTGMATPVGIRSQTNPYPDLRLDKDYFKQYMENPYPVKEVVFDVPVGHPTKHPTKILVYEGAWQRDTYYLRIQDADALRTKSGKNVLTGEVSGQTSDGAQWFFNGAASRGDGGEINVISSNFNDSASMTEAKFKALESLGQLRGACCFGLALMVPHSIIWHGDDFTILWFDSQWPHNTNAYIVNGSVLSYTNHLPVVIRLKSAKWPNTYRWVDFHYEYDFNDPNRFYPVNIWANLVLVWKIEVQGSTFQVPEIQFGASDLPKAGYEPADFAPAKPLIRPFTYISSNAATYLLGAGGQLEKIEPPIRPISVMTSKRLADCLLVMIFFIPAIFYLFVVMKKRKQKRRKDANKDAEKRGII
jgi:hypothetical protein